MIGLSHVPKFYTFLFLLSSLSLNIQSQEVIGRSGNPKTKITKKKRQGEVTAYWPIRPCCLSDAPVYGLVGGGGGHSLYTQF